jgi:superfamily I DNA/RNA helicase
MDAIEVARQRAAELHSQALARGLDPFQPLALALAEAERREIDVESTAPGSSGLQGARAHFDPAERLITYEDAGTDFIKAFLIAHELGHAELGDDPSPCEIEPSRPSEAAPTGTERVVDHNRRKRREVQMDLFAREFLLPRPFVCELHLTRKMSAADIAGKLDAPYDIVAQQLLDALLLPPIVPETKTIREHKEPNADQEKAIAHRGAPYLLTAGPGTGKTQTLTARIAALLDDKVDPREILVLTFSNKAAGEMSDRIAEHDAAAAAAMWIGTFHAFGLDILRRFGDRIGIDQAFRMIDRAEAVELIEDEFPRLDLTHYRNLYDPSLVIRDLLAAISRAKDEVVDAQAYQALVTAMAGRAKSGSDDDRAIAAAADEVARTYTLYERLKGPRRVDFGDLVMQPVKLLEQDSELQQHFAAIYKHVLVDEYQDVNRASVRLLRRLRPAGENLWAVGDIRQSIYRFRGASSHNMRLFKDQDFPNACGDRLTINYRSYQEVVDSFVEFAGGMRAGAGEGRSLQAERGNCGIKAQLRTSDRPGAASAMVAEAIAEEKAQGRRYRDQAVLCTGNDRLARIGRELETLGVPVLYLGSLFERPEVKDQLALLHLLTDPRGMALVRAGPLVDAKFELVDLWSAIQSLRGEEGLPPRWLGEDPSSSVTPAAAATMSEIARILAGFDANSQPWDVLCAVLLDRTDIARRYSQSDAVQDRSSAIALWQFMNFLRVQPTGPGQRIPRLLSRIRRLLRLQDERDLRQLPAAAQSLDAVRLMTVHGSKGLEFPVVHFPGMSLNTIPRPYQRKPCPPPPGMIAGASDELDDELRAAHEEEQQCLFYVALSRAKDRLYLYAETRNRRGKQGLSPFIANLNDTIQSGQMEPQLQLPTPPDEIPLPIDSSGLIFGASEVALYRRCARRFLYTYVLRLGGRRESTPFMDMHEVVRRVIRGISRSDGLPDDADIQRLIESEFENSPLGEHGYAADYKALSTAMVRFFASCRAGHSRRECPSLQLAIDGEIIVVTPDELLTDPEGRTVIRSNQTGHRPSKDDDDIATAAIVLAAKQALPGARVEVIYLADEDVVPVDLTQRKLDTRFEWIRDCLTGVRQGAYATTDKVFRCPGCPHLFHCDAVPSGTLKISP